MNEAYAICMDNYVVKPEKMPVSRWRPFPPKWEHCLIIKDKKEARDDAAKRSEGNSDLNKTLDVLKNLESK